MSPTDYTNDPSKTRLEYLESSPVEPPKSPPEPAPIVTEPTEENINRRIEAIRKGDIQRFEPGSGT